MLKFLVCLFLLFVALVAANNDGCRHHDVCAGVRCPSPTHCGSLQPECFTTPCCPIAACYCGNTVCQEDEECVVVPECFAYPCPKVCQKITSA